MLNDNVFDDWLDTKAKQIITVVGEGKALSAEQMMVLVLKAQNNHFKRLGCGCNQIFTRIKTAWKLFSHCSL